MPYAPPAPDDDDKSNKELVTDRETRMQAAVGMRIAGATYSEVARVLGYTSATNARAAVERSIAATVGEGDRDQARFLQTRRLERLLRSVWNRATDDKDPEQLGYVRTSLALVDRLIKLQGLDAPAEIIMYNPTQQELEEWVSKRAQLVTHTLPEEIDIVSSEVIESNLGDDQ